MIDQSNDKLIHDFTLLHQWRPMWKSELNLFGIPTPLVEKTFNFGIEVEQGNFKTPHHVTLSIWL